MIESMAKVVVFDQDIGRATENEDLVAFTVANVRMGADNWPDGVATI